MRSILSISLPEKVKKDIEKRAKKANKTVSAYVIHAFKIEKEMITEEELAGMAKKAKKDFISGKTKKLKSLSDLID